MAKSGEFDRSRSEHPDARKGLARAGKPAPRELIYGHPFPKVPTTVEEFIQRTDERANASAAVELYGYLGSSERFLPRIKPSTSVEAVRRNKELLEGIAIDKQVFGEVAEDFGILERALNASLIEAAHLYPQAREQAASDKIAIDDLRESIDEDPAFAIASPTDALIESTERVSRLLETLPDNVPGFTYALAKLKRAQREEIVQRSPAPAEVVGRVTKVQATPATVFGDVTIVRRVPLDELSGRRPATIPKEKRFVAEEIFRPGYAGEDYIPVIREDNKSGAIELPNGDIIKQEAMHEDVRTFILAIPDEVNLETALAPNTLARKFGEGKTLHDVHRIKRKAKLFFEQYGVYIEYDAQKGAYYRRFAERRHMPEVVRPATPAQVETRDLKEITKPKYAKLSDADIASLAGVLKNPNIQRKFAVISGLFDNKTLKQLEEHVDMRGLDSIDYAQGALQRVSEMIDSDPEAYENLVKGFYASQNSSNVRVGELLTAMQQIHETSVQTESTSDQLMTGLEYLALAVANSDIDIAMTPTPPPPTDTPLDVKLGKADTPEPVNAQPLVRPVERRVPGIRTRLEGSFRKYGGMPDLSIDGVDEDTILKPFDLTKPFIEDMMSQRNQYVQPIDRDGIVLFTPIDVAALVELKNLIKKRLTPDMYKSIVAIAEEVYESIGKQTIIDMRA